MRIYEFKNEKLILKLKEKVQEIAKFYANFGYGMGQNKICEKYLKKSDLIIYFSKNNKMVGAVRGLSDGDRFAFPLDLFVDPKYRRMGIGLSLFKAICQYYTKKNIRYIEFTTDPQDPGLEKFYKKLGCKKQKNSFVFEWKN